MKKAVFVYNPLSGHRSVPVKLDYIIDIFMRNNVLIQPYRISNDEHGGLIDVLKSGEYSYLIISGGDGTINLIVNSMLKNNIDLPVGIIPSGTCNDFARSLSIPADLKRCLDIILAGNMYEIDLGLINEEKYFLNTCAGGAFADVSFNTSSELKKKFGVLAYYLNALGEVAGIKPVKLNVRTDSDAIENDFLIFLILNGPHAAGFSNIIKKADFSDGFMDLVLIKNCLHIDLAALFFKLIANANDFINDRNIIWLRAKNCIIEGSGEVALTVDGEKGGSLPLEVRFINKRLKVFAK